MSEPAVALNAGSSLPASQPSHGIGFYDVKRAWVRVAALSFGGPAGQIATSNAHDCRDSADDEAGAHAYYRL